MVVTSAGRRPRWTLAGLTLFATSLAVVVAAGLATDRLLSLARLPPGPVWRAVGLGLLLSGIGLCTWCVALFGRARGTPVPVNPPTELIQSGPYAWVRNPMLTGVFAALFGAGVLLRSPSIVLLWAPVYVLLHVLELRRVEEPELERRFGVAYRAYRDAVPAFLPLPRTTIGRRLRRLPPVCALSAAFSALVGRLRFRRRLVGTKLVMDDGRTYRVFRHLSLQPSRDSAERPAVLVVRFRFARLSGRANRSLSLLPVPVIGGHPGFRHKLWMADARGGWWQGVYEWATLRDVDAYRASVVFRTMERRAAPGTLSVAVIESRQLAEWLNDHRGDTGTAAEPAAVGRSFFRSRRSP
jgi:protein-S-isoprenylcysteine O-methyltransferase Ste14